MIGQKIQDLIMTHIKLWHKTSPARLDKSLSDFQVLKLFMETRDFNAVRAAIRDEINKYFKDGCPDPKINYTEE